MKEEIFKNKLFILESTKTNQPFLTQNGECLLFLDPKEATEMAKQYENVRVSDPKFYKIAEFYALCYAAGASSVVLGVGEKKENFLLDEKRNLPHRFYNHAMVKTVALLKQYGDTLSGLPSEGYIDKDQYWLYGTEYGDLKTHGSDDTMNNLQELSQIDGAVWDLKFYLPIDLGTTYVTATCIEDWDLASHKSNADTKQCTEN